QCECPDLRRAILYRRSRARGLQLLHLQPRRLGPAARAGAGTSRDRQAAPTIRRTAAASSGRRSKKLPTTVASSPSIGNQRGLAAHRALSSSRLTTSQRYSDRSSIAAECTAG